MHTSKALLCACSPWPPCTHLLLHVHACLHHDLQQVIDLPAAVRRKALDEGADLGCEVRLEVGIRHCQVVQQLTGQHADVTFIHKPITAYTCAKGLNM